MALGWASVKQSKVTEPPNGSPTICAGTHTIGGTGTRRKKRRKQDTMSTWWATLITNVKKIILTFHIDPDPLGNGRRDTIGRDTQISSRFRPSNFCQHQSVAFHRRHCILSKQTTDWNYANADRTLNVKNNLLSSFHRWGSAVRLRDAKWLWELGRHLHGRWALRVIPRGQLCATRSCRHRQSTAELHENPHHSVNYREETGMRYEILTDDVDDADLGDYGIRVDLAHVAAGILLFFLTEELK